MIWLILNIVFSLDIFILSQCVSHPVSKYRDSREAKIGKPVTILAAINCNFFLICQNQ